MPDKSGKKIVMVHYHLRRGGVTRVIEAAREALRPKGYQILILTGEAPLPDFPQHDVRVIPALNYRRSGSSVIAENLAELLKEEAEEHFNTTPSLWHFHNPTLAKNVMIPSVVRDLAESGQKVLLQLHDFAEDGRPGNYSSQRAYFETEAVFQKTLYPKAKQIHYATVNQRDHDFLKEAGISRRNLHVVPNAVNEIQVTTSPVDRPIFQDKLLALYPTRGIRRKNIGEILLLSLIYGERVHFATTLSPENPEWRAVHQQWVDAVEELELPVTLGIGDDGQYAFADLLGWADFVVTTSVAEGFGLAFLEPWVIGKSLFGRDLPEITRDFRANGLDLGSLYQSIDIPVEWLEEGELMREIDAMLRRSYLAYDADMPVGALKTTWRAWVRNGKIDFGVLNETMQLRVLRLLKGNPELMDQMNFPALSLCSQNDIRQRRELIRDIYSLNSYADRLDSVYDLVRHSSVSKVKHLPTQKVLEQFLDPLRLNLLRN